jgi:hypothetical protein
MLSVAATVGIIFPAIDKEVKVPTLVSDEATTVEDSVVPVRVPAAAVIVQVEPSVQVCPLTVVALFARYALAIGVPFHTPVVIVPTVVSEELTMLLANVVPVRVPADAAPAGLTTCAVE